MVIHRINISGCHYATFTLETSGDSDAGGAIISKTLLSEVEKEVNLLQEKKILPGVEKRKAATAT
jgi:hypothetical protein